MPPFEEATMNDPHDGAQPTGDEELSAHSDEMEDLDDVSIDPEDAERVKGGRLEDPCGGGQIRNK
jgi:hypothetical protein